VMGGGGKTAERWNKSQLVSQEEEAPSRQECRMCHDTP
jgi:hypothetical protein